MCEYFGVVLRSEDAHDALADVRTTVELYREMGQGKTGAVELRLRNPFVLRPA